MREEEGKEEEGNGRGRREGVGRKEEKRSNNEGARKKEGRTRTKQKRNQEEQGASTRSKGNAPHHTIHHFFVQKN